MSSDTETKDPEFKVKTPKRPTNESFYNGPDSPRTSGKAIHAELRLSNKTMSKQEKIDAINEVWPQFSNGAGLNNITSPLTQRMLDAFPDEKIRNVYAFGKVDGRDPHVEFQLDVETRDSNVVNAMKERLVKEIEETPGVQEHLAGKERVR